MIGVYGDYFNFPQENKPDVSLKTFGNKSYARYENTDGYSVVFDKSLGQYCYAELKSNRFISSGVTLDNPSPEGVVRHLEESSAVIQERVEAHNSQNPVGASSFDSINETFGPNQGLLNGRQLSIGKVRGLTILVNFADISSATTRDEVDLMLNGSNYQEHGNTCSVRDYFLTMSSNKLDYTNTVVGPFTLKHNRSYYIENSLVEEAFDLAVASGVDLTNFDSQAEGIVDALNILYAGDDIYKEELWPHNHYIDLEHGGVRTNLYLLTSFGSVPEELSIGTFCHENGHLLCRFPDLYDYGDRDGNNEKSSGLGTYCLMGSGNHLNGGRTPAPVCAYLRNLVGWCDNVVDLNVSDTYEAKHGDYNTVMKYSTSKVNEYFIVENRAQIGLDSFLASSGLAVYHCDILGSNEHQQGTPDKHYQCALLQADGHRDLERDPTNTGDIGDLYAGISGPAITNATNPSTREWNRSDSQLVISNISSPGQVITFQTGNVEQPTKASGNSQPDLLIPDNAPNGVNDTINIESAGIVRKIQVSFKIDHPSVEDLTVKLTSPTQRQSLLHVRTGGGADDNLLVSLNSDNFGELNSFVGQPIQGDWVLNVSDAQSQSIGKLARWEINIQL